MNHRGLHFVAAILGLVWFYGLVYVVVTLLTGYPWSWLIYGIPGTARYNETWGIGPNGTVLTTEAIQTVEIENVRDPTTIVVPDADADDDVYYDDVDVVGGVGDDDDGDGDGDDDVDDDDDDDDVDDGDDDDDDDGDDGEEEEEYDDNDEFYQEYGHIEL